LDWKTKGDQVARSHLDFFIKWCIKVFGEGNFFLECQPAKEDNFEQWLVNNTILELSEEYGVDYIITTDAHYLKKEHLSIHSAFLNSSEDGGDREVESFYATTYIMSEEEIYEYFKPFWTKEQIKKGIDCTDNIGSRTKRFIFNKKPIIARVLFEENWENNLNKNFFPKSEYIQKTLNSEHKDDQYLMYRLQKGILKLIPEEDYKETFYKIEEELKEVWEVSKILEDRMHSYFILVSKIVEIMWNEGDSFVGVGRGSVVVSLVAYLLEITQLNPLKMPVDLPFYRFMTAERADFLDIDLDSQHDRRARILEALKTYFNSFGGDVVSCSTYSTLTSKSAIQTACRGLEIETEISQLLSSLIPFVRGKTYSLTETYFGDEEEGIKPVPEFVNIVDSYKDQDLLGTALLIEGLIINRSIHAGGVFFLNDEIYNHNAIMMSPTGVRCTQWDLHESEKFGLIKVDLLTTKGMSKLRKTIELLIEDKRVERKDSLKETYMSVISPMGLKYDTEKTWELIGNNEVVDLFQFNTDVAKDVLSAIKPQNIIQLFQANSLMRLQKQDDADESPVETYVKFKNDNSLAYEEMDKYEVPKKDQEFLAEMLEKFSFVADTQEIVMELVRSPKILGFSIKKVHEVRKSIAKKSQSAQDKIKKDLFERAMEIGVSENTVRYIWEVQIKRQCGYAFSIPHVVAYTYIALQQLYLYQNFPSVYWDTACLTINSGAEEDELSRKKNQTTQYGRIAKAISDMQHQGKTISLPDINKANFEFKPDAESNSIIFGLKGVSNISDDSAERIILNRPYRTIEEFIEKISPTKQQLISLVKAGSFDNFEDFSNRHDFMKRALFHLGVKTFKDDTKTSLNMQNFQSIVSMKLLEGSDLLFVRFWKFKKYILSEKFKQGKVRNKVYYKLDSISKPFFEEYFSKQLDKDKDFWYNEQEEMFFLKSSFDKVYGKHEEEIRERISKKEFIEKYNNTVISNFVEEFFSKYCEGTQSKWEMDAISFYHGDHELKNVNLKKYNAKNFADLPQEPIFTEQPLKNGKFWRKYELSRVMGTVLDVNKNKHIVYLLTVDGVVNIKFDRGSFSFYNKTIVETDEDGNKQREVSWFKRGTKLMVLGYRTQQYFRPKKYYDSIYRHTLAKIEEVYEDGDLLISLER
jgi:DNA polymerase-3 subunit alpha